MTDTAPAAPTQSFAALRHPGFRAYFIGSALAMMADSIEHVISYWMLFQKFHSPGLAGFAVISHWVPFLLFSVFTGSLADRFDPRRIIQVGMLFFMVASAGWGWFFLTDTLQTWHAVLLLTIHGLAGVLWGPPSQILIYDIVGRAKLPSAVRLLATARWLGLLFGPVIGATFLLALGPTWGIFANAAIYLPLTLWLWRAPYGPRFRAAGDAAARAMRGFADIVATLRDVAADRTLASMTLLAGAASLTIGSGYQSQMPSFAQDLGHGNAGVFYSMLLAADAAGAMTAGVLLEGRGWLPARPHTAMLLALTWCAAIGGFALAPSYPIALALLFVAGFVSLSFNAMAQTLVQLHAPVAHRGRVIGLYNMSGLGLRAFSGVTIGLVGTMVGVHASLALSALALFTITLGLLAFHLRRGPAAAGSSTP
ncbi:MAG: MFS transporter [Pseudomonadota bacterium]